MLFYGDRWNGQVIQSLYVSLKKLFDKIRFVSSIQKIVHTAEPVVSSPVEIPSALIGSHLWLVCNTVWLVPIHFPGVARPNGFHTGHRCGWRKVLQESMGRGFKAMKQFTPNRLDPGASAQRHALSLVSPWYKIYASFRCKQHPPPHPLWSTCNCDQC